METKLKKIAEVAKERPKERITSLAYLINKESIIEVHKGMKIGKATGVDKITKEEYAKNLITNVDSLIERMKKQAYKPQPVRRAYIPKIGSDKMRPLGIPAYEDKLVQGVISKILNAVFEGDFLDSSFGFRPNRSCHPGLTIIYLVNNLPLVIWVMFGFFKEIPIDLEEAAIVDGASPIRSFLQIVLPLVKPGVVATSILALIFTWNELMFSITLTATQATTLPVAIYDFVSYSQIDWGSLASSAVLAILPVAIFVLIVQKHLVSGLTFGAVKG